MVTCYLVIYWYVVRVENLPNIAFPVYLLFLPYPLLSFLHLDLNYHHLHNFFSFYYSANYQITGKVTPLTAHHRLPRASVSLYLFLLQMIGNLKNKITTKTKIKEQPHMIRGSRVLYSCYLDEYEGVNCQPFCKATHSAASRTLFTV